MRKKYSVLMVLMISAVSFFSSLTGYVFGVRASREKKEPVQIVTKAVVQEKKNVYEEKKEEVKKQEDTETYRISIKNGNVAIYIRSSDGNEELYKEYDIPVSLLPQSDREMLKTGIEYKTLSEALQLIEDYL